MSAQVVKVEAVVATNPGQGPSATTRGYAVVPPLSGEQSGRASVGSVIEAEAPETLRGSSQHLPSAVMRS